MGLTLAVSIFNVEEKLFWHQNMLFLRTRWLFFVNILTDIGIKLIINAKLWLLSIKTLTTNIVSETVTPDNATAGGLNLLQYNTIP